MSRISPHIVPVIGVVFLGLAGLVGWAEYSARNGYEPIACDSSQTQQMLDDVTTKTEGFGWQHIDSIEGVVQIASLQNRGVSCAATLKFGVPLLRDIRVDYTVMPTTDGKQVYLQITGVE